MKKVIALILIITTFNLVMSIPALASPDLSSYSFKTQGEASPSSATPSLDYLDITLIASGVVLGVCLIIVLVGAAVSAANRAKADAAAAAELEAKEAADAAAAAEKAAYEAANMPTLDVITTSAVQLVERVTSDGMPKANPRLSPDATTLIYEVIDNSKIGSMKYSIQGKTLGKEGIMFIAAAPAQYPAWFPDGKQIIYVVTEGTNKIVRKLTEGSGWTYISPNAVGLGDGELDMRSNGETIAFSTMRDSKWYIGSVRPNGTEFIVYTEGSSPRWHPKENLLAFSRVSPSGVEENISIMPLGGNISQITMGNSYNKMPIWSPDGKWIAFVSNRSGLWHLYVMKPDGSSVTQLTTGKAQVYYPEWGSDGYIYFTSNAGATKYYSWPSERGQFSEIWRIKPNLPE